MESQEHARAEYRKKRVKKIKTIILWLVGILLIYPIIASVYFQCTISNLQGQLTSLEVQLQETKNAIGTLAMQMAVTDDVAPESIQNTGQISDDIIQGQYEKAVYLTFDDGPSESTKAILDILDEYHAKATFFVVGDKRDSLDEWYHEIVSRGHSIGLHSYTHDYDLIYKSPEAYKDDLDRLQDKIFELTGTTTDIVRFPGGSSNSATMDQIESYIRMLNVHDFTYFDWNISSGDASSSIIETPEEMANRIASAIRDEEQPVVLMHDASDKKTTVEALSLILEDLKEEDYVFLPINNETKVVQHITNKIE